MIPFEIKEAVRVIRQYGVFGVLSKLSRYVRLTLELYRNRRLTNGRGLEALVEFGFTAYGGLIKPFQDKNEILRLLRLLDTIKPRTIMEIGTACGGNLFLLCRVAAPDALVISVDLPGGIYGGGYPAWRIPIYRQFPVPPQRLRLIRANSHSLRTTEKVRKILDGRRIDFLFIDGDHTYEGARADFELYSPLVRDGGLIAFHDIHELQQQPGCAVHKLWKEVKQEFQHQEIINDPHQNWAGIGVITWRGACCGDEHGMPSTPCDWKQSSAIKVTGI